MKLKSVFANVWIFFNFNIAQAQIIQGTTEVEYSKIFAMNFLGDTFLPQYDIECEAAYSAMRSTHAIFKYTINTKTNVQNTSLQYATQEIPLSTMGIANQYAFIASSIPQPLHDIGIDNIFFTMDLKFTHFSSHLMLALIPVRSIEAGFQCFLST